MGSGGTFLNKEVAGFCQQLLPLLLCDTLTTPEAMILILLRVFVYSAPTLRFLNMPSNTTISEYSNYKHFPTDFLLQGRVKSLMLLPHIDCLPTYYFPIVIEHSWLI